MPGLPLTLALSSVLSAAVAGADRPALARRLSAGLTEVQGTASRHVAPEPAVPSGPEPFGVGA